MIATTFIDTNVLVYAASNAGEDREKRTRARQLLCQPDIAFSAQVLQEFYVSAVTKKKLEMTHEEVVAVLHPFVHFPFSRSRRNSCLMRPQLKFGSVFRIGMLQY